MHAASVGFWAGGGGGGGGKGGKKEEKRGLWVEGGGTTAEIPEDPKSAIVRAEFERVRADAFLAQPRGLYAQVYLRRNFTIDDAAKRTRFQCAAFHLTRDGAKPQDGYLCVTSWNNKFVKLRLTTLSDNNTEAARSTLVSSPPGSCCGAPAAAPAPSRSKPTSRRRACRAASPARPLQRPMRAFVRCPARSSICET